MKKVIVLLGPTGVGKTGASILLAKELNTEIISADSMQIYRHMDIGTAKPSEAERANIRHHMIDVVEPSEAYSAGRYISDVVPIIEGIFQTGKTPIIVGGTGLYIKAMTRGIFNGPSSDLELRERLLAREEEEKGSLYAHLSEIDPETAGRTERNNIRRIIRAIEVCLKSGSSLSSLQKDLTRPLPYDFIKIGITRAREELYQMIDARVDAMFKSGLIDEVRSIMQMNPDRTPLQAIGYKEIAKYLNREIDLSEAERLMKRNSRRYAKRQFTWFRQEEGIIWIDVTGTNNGQEVFQAVRQATADIFPAAAAVSHKYAPKVLE
ncbi:MAG: tRNA (adenosine(37)-N6)-dimethylallyltransferase MiaA [Nitrospirae bacterium]|nr:tRNA (adenosine(37)-N6)-dimethylallyltransferase MiaA [Nitrospirota bacterium]